MNPRLQNILFGNKILRSEIYCLSMNLMWGIWVLLHEQALNPQVYIKLTEIVHEDVSGVLALYLGLLQVIALIGNSIKWRKVGLFLSWTFWGFIGIILLAGGTRSPAPLIYCLQGMIFGWSYLRLVGDHYYNGVKDKCQQK